MAIDAKATQEFVPIKQVRDGFLVLKNGDMRAVLLASSVNLSLKSEDEQHAIISQFQAFLNSLEFSTQIVVQSRRLDIRPYLILLENRMREQLEPLLKIQTREYIEFIRNFTETNSIMTKNFFIVVPYSGASASIVPSGIFSSKPQVSKEDEEKVAFEEKRTQLEQRMSVIEQGLSRIGVRTFQLGTEELVELFYKVFNPGETSQSAKIDLK
ncbi:MAG: hypothetical protein WC795_02135 [Candidatus Paceibacterota bacterium]|jgi:hypothetical protein